MACGNDPEAPEPAAERTWRMGFGANPPRPTIEDILATIDAWSPRADVAIMHVSVPWGEMLDGMAPDAHVEAELLDLATLYRSRGFPIVFVADPTDGLARDQESPALRERGRSIAEPEIQALYVAWVEAVVALLQPDWLALAAETNLIRLAAPASTYAGLVAMTDSAARRIGSMPETPTLMVSVQVETAWGRLGGTGAYEGIAADLGDYAWIDALGLSSYPYLGGFEDPADIPLDYYARLGAESGLPVLVVEGGWPSTSAAGQVSSPGEQAAYLRRQARLLDAAEALAVLQLTYTDIDLESYQPAPEILELFATLGLVEVSYQPKPALAVWDSLFVLPRND